MHARLYSATTVGVDAQLIEIEADLGVGLVSFLIVGLPDKAITESKERIKAALKNCGFTLPTRSITINLAPAHIKKQDVLFDVGITIAILQAEGALALTAEFLEETLFVGELALDGNIRPVPGVLAVADCARRWGKRRVIVPEGNMREAALVQGLEVIGMKRLSELIAYLLTRGEVAYKAPSVFDIVHEAKERQVVADIADVAGQSQAKRALLIAAAGHHNVVMMGPPGSGKTMLAQRLPGILPPLTFDEIVGVTKVYSVAGLLGADRVMVQRPFRNPHHTISQAGLIGGGSVPRPGEVSLAHHGVLFLDELTEFSRSTIEVLRQPLESGEVRIARAQCSVVLPASFLLVAALNPCPCGYYGQPERCKCSRGQVQAYLGKLSGPLLDRIDLQVTVRAVQYEQVHILRESDSMTSAQLSQLVARVRQKQRDRGQPAFNGQLQGSDVARYCQMTMAAQTTIATCFDRLNLSMRGYHKILKVARTIADLEGCVEVDSAHVHEALSLRTL